MDSWNCSRCWCCRPDHSVHVNLSWFTSINRWIVNLFRCHTSLCLLLSYSISFYHLYCVSNEFVVAGRQRHFCVENKTYRICIMWEWVMFCSFVLTRGVLPSYWPMFELPVVTLPYISLLPLLPALPLLYHWTLFTIPTATGSPRTTNMSRQWAMGSIHRFHSSYCIVVRIGRKQLSFLTNPTLGHWPYSMVWQVHQQSSRHFGKNTCRGSEWVVQWGKCIIIPGAQNWV